MTASALHKSLATLALALAAAVPTASQAQTFKLALKAGADFGGDSLVSEVYTKIIPSFGTETKSLKANEGFYAGGGVLISFSNEIETEISLSYKEATFTTTRSDIKFTRMPLDALVFYRVENLRVGGGITYHIKPKVSGIADVPDIRFDNALGKAVQLEYFFAKRFTVGGRYTILDYKSRDGVTANSDGFGATFSVRFF